MIVYKDNNFEKILTLAKDTRYYFDVELKIKEYIEFINGSFDEIDLSCDDASVIKHFEFNIAYSIEKDAFLYFDYSNLNIYSKDLLYVESIRFYNKRSKLSKALISVITENSDFNLLFEAIKFEYINKITKKRKFENDLYLNDIDLNSNFYKFFIRGKIDVNSFVGLKNALQILYNDTKVLKTQPAINDRWKLINRFSDNGKFELEDFDIIFKDGNPKAFSLLELFETHSDILKEFRQEHLIPELAKKYLSDVNKISKSYELSKLNSILNRTDAYHSITFLYKIRDLKNYNIDNIYIENSLNALLKTKFKDPFINYVKTKNIFLNKKYSSHLRKLLFEITK